MQKGRIHPMLLAGVAVAALAMAWALWLLLSQKKPVITQAESAAAGSLAADAEGFGSSIVYNGSSYTRNTDLKTILFLGIDQASDAVRDEVVGNGGRSDMMALLILDPQKKEIQLLQISRDTMMPVDIYSVDDRYLYTATMQLTLQYACGSSAKRSCWLTKNKVSELLYGVPVDYTVSLTMDGISSVVDAIGGIALTVPEDYTEIDPQFQKGASLTLDGTQAVRYVRYRDTSVTGSNDDRMVRQTQVLRAVAAQLKAGNATAEIDAIQTAAGPYLESDLDADTLYALSQYALEEPMLKVPGETREGAQHDEYHIDDEALRAMVMELFYQPVTP